VRKLPSIMLGALMLPVGFLPTAAFADPTPTPTVTASVTPTATPSTTASATPSSPVSPTPSASVTPTPSTSPTPPADDFLTGEFSYAPGHGKPGTVIAVKSKDLCVDSAGKVGTHVEVIMINAADIDSEDFPLTEDKLLATDSSGAWATTLKIPAKAKAGDVYVLDAACFAAGATVDDDPFLIYAPTEFTVTEAAKAPVATPVTGNPKFTG
jgi:cytoskeletal protein RodZ